MGRRPLTLLAGRRPVPPRWSTVAGVGAAAALALGGTPWVALVAVGVPLALACYRRPQRGVLAFAALLPLDGLRPVLGLPDAFGGWKQATVLTLLLLTFVCPPAARAGGPPRRWPPWLPAFAALAVLGLASAALAGWGTNAVLGLRITFFEALIAVVVWRCPLSRAERDALVTVFAAMAFLTSLVGLWQQVVGHEYLRRLGYEYDEAIRFTSGFRLRSFGTFNQPFPFALYLMLAILVVTPFALAEPRRLRSRLYALSLPVVAGALVLTFVRAAYLGLAVGLLYLAFHRYKLLVYGIPFALLAFAFLPTGTTFTEAIFQRESLEERTAGWSDRLDQLAEHPLGIGIGETGAAAEKAAQLRGLDPGLQYQPDNAYLKVAFELGIPGLWFFVRMLVSMVLYGRAVERRVADPDRHLAAGATAQLLGLVVAGLVATIFEMVPVVQLFWLMAGVVATLAPRPRGPVRPPVPTRPPVTV